MTDRQIDLFEPIENAAENLAAPENQPIFEPLIYEPPKTATCIICGGQFVATISRASLCSDPCRRERRLRYGAAYREQGREARRILCDMFGGRRPTEEEILQLLQKRKGKP